MRTNSCIVILIILSSLFGCKSKNNPSEEVQNQLNSHLINANKILTHTESQDIEKYISEKGWEMLKTGTGLRYKINGTGKGDFINDDEKVIISGKVSLMYEDLVIYSFDRQKPFVFNMGKAEDPKGLEEGLKMMKKGQTAIMILPSHLGFGLSGDAKSIPPKAVLVYQVEILDVTNK
jgi:FKBP-type peptidyl-prolyl cis-trans isomerase FkpA